MSYNVDGAQDFVKPGQTGVPPPTAYPQPYNTAPGYYAQPPPTAYPQPLSYPPQQVIYEATPLVTTTVVVDSHHLGHAMVRRGWGMIIGGIFAILISVGISVGLLFAQVGVYWFGFGLIVFGVICIVFGARTVVRGRHLIHHGHL